MLFFFFFFFNDTATTEIYTLSLHDALPILLHSPTGVALVDPGPSSTLPTLRTTLKARSEEHTSELQSLTNLVCRLLLEKKKKHRKKNVTITLTSTQQIQLKGKHTDAH